MCTRKCAANTLHQCFQRGIGLSFPLYLVGSPRSSSYVSLPLTGSPFWRGKTQTKTAKKIKQLRHDEFSLSDGVHLLQLQFQLFFLLAGVAPPRDMRKPYQLPGPSRESHTEALLSPSHLTGRAGAGSCRKQSHRLC